MKGSTSKEKILKNIRNALIDKAENPYPDLDFESNVYNEKSESLDIIFAEAFTKVAGKFIYCADQIEFLNNLQQLISDKQWDGLFCRDGKLRELLYNAKIPYDSNEERFNSLNVGITACEFLVARLGTIVVSSGQISGRKMNVYPETHVVVAYKSQLVPDLKHAIRAVKQKYDAVLPSMISFITGPSRTADIEKTLVMGAHGPKDLYLFFIDDTPN